MPALTENPDGTPHTHSYVRARKADLKPDFLRYRCDHPDCSHIELKANLYGKRSLCPKCRKTTFVLDSQSLKLSRPVCLACGQTKKARQVRGIANTFEEMFKSQEKGN